jgi:hypothetical protein
MIMPQLTKQQKPSARPPAVSAAVMAVHAERFNSLDVPALLASLADRFGVKPSDVPTFAPALPALRKAKLDPAKIGPVAVSQAGGIWRAGIAATLGRVDELNTATLKRLGDDSRMAEGGDVRTLQRRAEPVVTKPKPPAAEKPRKNGLEILGSPVTLLLRAIGRAGFSVSAARAAMDELGGIGVKDATIKSNMRQGAAEDFATLTDEQLAELEPFRHAEPEPREEEQRQPRVVVPRSVEVLD